MHSRHTLTPDEQRALEALIDHTTLDTVADALATICTEKAQHLRDAWHDETHARIWERASHAFTRAANNDAVRAAHPA